MNRKTIIGGTELAMRAMASRSDVALHIGGTRAYTDNKIIVIPALPDDDEEMMVKIRGFVDHEIGHVVLTDFNIPHTMWINILEDVRIEKARGEQYPGVAINLRKLTDLLINEDEFKASPDDPLGQLAMWAVSRGRHRVLRQNSLAIREAEAEEFCRQSFGDEFSDKFVSIVDRVEQAKSTKDCKILADEIEALIGKAAEDAAESEHEDDSHQDGSGQDGESSGAEGQDLAQDGNSSPDAGIGEGDGDQQEGDSSQSQANSGEDSSEQPGQNSSKNDKSESDSDSGDGGSSRDGKEQKEDSSQSNSDDEEESSEKPGQDPAQDGNSSSDSSDGEGDKQEGNSSQSDSGSEGKPGQPDNSPQGTGNQTGTQDQGEGEADNSNKPASNSHGKGLTQKQRDALRSLAGAQTEANVDVGEILRELLDMGDDYEPATKVQIPATETAPDNAMKAVSNENWLRHAKENTMKELQKTTGLRSQLAGLFQAQHQRHGFSAQSGHRLGKKNLHLVAVNTPDKRIFSVRQQRKQENTAISILVDSSGSMTGQMTLALNASYAVAKCIESMNGVTCNIGSFPECSLYDEDIMVVRDVKPFGAQPDLRRFYLVDSGGSTPTAEALLWAGQQLTHRRENRKMVILFTDGDPDCIIQTQDAVKKIKECGIELYVVAMGDSPEYTLTMASRWVDKSLVSPITKIEELGPALMKLLKYKLIQAA